MTERPARHPRSRPRKVALPAGKLERETRSGGDWSSPHPLEPDLWIHAAAALEARSSPHRFKRALGKSPKKLSVLLIFIEDDVENIQMLLIRGTILLQGVDYYLNFTMVFLFCLMCVCVLKLLLVTMKNYSM